MNTHLILNNLLRNAVIDNENINIVKFLVSKGADIHQKDDNDNLLHIACRYNITNIDIIKFLIEKNVNINSLDNFNNNISYYLLNSNLSYHDLNTIFNKLKNKGLIIDENELTLHLNEKLKQIDNSSFFIGC